MPPAHPGGCRPDAHELPDSSHSNKRSSEPQERTRELKNKRSETELGNRTRENISGKQLGKPTWKQHSENQLGNRTRKTNSETQLGKPTRKNKDQDRPEPERQQTNRTNRTNDKYPASPRSGVPLSVFRFPGCVLSSWVAGCLFGVATKGKGPGPSRTRVTTDKPHKPHK